MNISAWAIRNPVPTIILFIATTLAGWWGFNALRINHEPDLEVPVVIVTVTQPGAAPSEMETQIARKIEDAVISIGDIKHLRSTLRDGVSQTVADFVYGVDPEKAVNDVRDAVTKLRPDLPAGINEPVVAGVDNRDGVLLTYAVEAPHMSERDLSWFIDNEISRELLTARGVAVVTRSGGIDREIRVNLNPDRLMALGITATDVSRQLRILNVDRPGGRGTIGAAEQSIRTLGSAETVEDLREAKVILPGGRSARLADLGTVEDGAADIRQVARINNKSVVAFEVQRAKHSSEVHVAKAVEEKIAALERAHPDINIKLIYSQAAYTGEMFTAAMEALVLGALLAVLVVWWFLRDMRATLISAFAMPMAAIPTFAVMVWMDFTMNNITLIGLSLVVGILVDDAIVEMENIIRHMRMGKTPYDAAMVAADEIGLPVVATSATIVAVFLPVAFIPDVAGQFFRQFGFTVAAAVMFSLLVARLLTPLMGAYLLKNHGEENIDTPTMTRYLALLRWCLHNRFKTLMGGIGFFVASLALLPFIEQDLFPAADRAQSAMSIELAPGATLAETEAVARKVTDMMLARPEVIDVYANIGGRGLLGDVRKGIVIVKLKPKGDRKLSQQEFETSMRPALATIPGVRLRFGADGLASTRTSVTLGSDDPVALDKAVQQLEREMRTIPGLGNVGSTASLQRPELIITPSLDRAADLGVSIEAISSTAQIATLGDNDTALPKFTLPGRQIPIRVQLAEDARGDLDVLQHLRVPGTNGAAVPLSAVADISFGSGPAQINRLDRRRMVSIEAEISGKPLGQVTREIHELPAFQTLPESVQEIKQGESELMGEVFGYIGTAILFGSLMVYAVLVLLFGSFIHPLTIMTALPLSLGGALTFLLLAGSALSMPAVIGVLMLLGIVAKNSILLVEYTEVAMKERAMNRFDALMDAAHKRARPIVMTTIAMTAGMAPVALKFGADAEFRSSMAICVIGGLLTSTLLSLLFVPVAFTYMDDFQHKAAPYLRRLIGGKSAAPKTEERSAPAE
ncbi:MAG: efflux RND transporter permease subunit [Rhodospirillaceae bacterium]|nr:efflux RND transporter permease subunit [Rhodospirillaceae bacterium]